LAGASRRLRYSPPYKGGETGCERDALGSSRIRREQLAALARRRKAIATRFGRCDLEYLARERGSHPLLRDAIEATYRHFQITPAQVAAFGRMLNAERALEVADDGPWASRAAALEEHFGMRNVFKASYDSLRYLRPRAI
jgi:hypothetical protein